ncbi:hypothetical protein BJV40_000005 [Clostridium beijerinckii]|nr:hypothetical protein [Clostridium beijerinckii]
MQIIHAPKVWEFIDDNHEESLQYADILSCNLYLHYTSKIFIGNTIDIYEDIAKSFYNNEYDIIKK